MLLVMLMPSMARGFLPDCPLASEKNCAEQFLASNESQVLRRRGFGEAAAITHLQMCSKLFTDTYVVLVKDIGQHDVWK